MVVNSYIFNSNEMKRYLYFIATIIFFFIIDGSGRLVLNAIVNNIPDNSSHLSKVNKSLTIDDVDFIVVGMSSAEHNYNVAIIEDSLKMRGYDCGSDGRNVFYDYMVVKNAIVNNKNLKLVLVDVNYYTLTNVTKDRINIVYPFYWKNQVVRDVTKELKGEKMDVLMLSSMYQMNSGIQNVYRLFHPVPMKEYRGYSPYPYTGKEVKQISVELPTKDFIVDDMAINYLTKIINECKENNIAVVLVTSPNLVNDEETTVYLNNYSLSKQVKYLDYSKIEQIINNRKLFRDYAHLNEKGADVFSEMLSVDIRSQIIK